MKIKYSENTHTANKYNVRLIKKFCLSLFGHTTRNIFGDSMYVIFKASDLQNRATQSCFRV